MAAGLDREKLALYLPASEAAIHQARAFVDRLEALDAPGREGSRIRLSVAVTDAMVRVEIADRGRGFSAETRTMPDAAAESGRELAFLDALADRWGVVNNSETCVWFELDFRR